MEFPAIRTKVALLLNHLAACTKRHSSCLRSDDFANGIQQVSLLARSRQVSVQGGSVIKIVLSALMRPGGVPTFRIDPTRPSHGRCARAKATVVLPKASPYDATTS